VRLYYGERLSALAVVKAVSAVQHTGLREGYASWLFLSFFLAEENTNYSWSSTIPELYVNVESGRTLKDDDRYPISTAVKRLKTNLALVLLYYLLIIGSYLARRSNVASPFAVWRNEVEPFKSTATKHTNVHQSIELETKMRIFSRYMLMSSSQASVQRAGSLHVSTDCTFNVGVEKRNACNCHQKRLSKSRVYYPVFQHFSNTHAVRLLTLKIDCWNRGAPYNRWWSNTEIPTDLAPWHVLTIEVERTSMTNHFLPRQHRIPCFSCDHKTLSFGW